MKSFFSAVFFSVSFLFSGALVSEETTPNVVKEDCSCTALSWQEVFDQSNHVVFGEVKTVQNHGDALATGDFRNLEVFKGEENYVTRIVGSAVKGGSCREVLRSGFYLVFVKDSNSAVLNPCSQNRKLNDDLVSTLKAVQVYAESKVISKDMSAESKETAHENIAVQKPEQIEESSGDWWNTLMEWKQDILDWFEE